MAFPQTPTVWAEEREIRQAPPLVAFTLAAFFAVMIFLPPEGRIGVPLHDGLGLLLGRATFMVPVTLTLAGVLLVVRALRPSMPLPRRRLAGIGLLALAVLPSEHLLGSTDDGTGLIGKWLSTWLLDLLGGPGTLVLLLAVLGLGVLLAFDVKLLRVGHAAS
ncbi:MAG TPA: DNA translocase FtsK 4TM domain-containing protein [Chloroflexota bacterium]|nr:DNA translocase FtsK 4TM domain-containing protein [Chloroflexota bacterium]